MPSSSAPSEGIAATDQQTPASGYPVCSGLDIKMGKCVMWLWEIYGEVNRPDVTYVWNLIHGTDELVYKTETDSRREDLWLQMGMEGGGGRCWEFGVSRSKLLCIVG